MIQFSDFQKNFEKKLDAHLNREGIRFSKEAKQKQNEAFLFYTIHHLEAFIFKDEAQIQGPGIDERYEPTDFENEPNEMMESFCRELSSFAKDKNQKSVGLFQQIRAWLKF